MIGFSRSDLAKKYAQAYLNVVGDSHSFDDYFSMWRAAQFLSEHHNLLFYLSLSIIDESDKKRFIDLFFNKFHLFASLKELFYLLLKHKNICLAADVLRDIYALYKMKHHVVDLQVKTSFEISEIQINDIKNFFTRLTGQTPYVHHYIDSSLIAGIRLQTETYLWEYSIAQQLRKIKQELIA